MPALAIAWFILVVTLPLEPILCTEYINGDVSSPFTFYPLDCILSHGSLVRFKMQSAGNVKMQTYSSGSWSSADWSTNTNPDGDHVDLQDDGKLVVFDAKGGILWQSNSITGTSPFRLIVTDDVETYILDSLNKIVWSTNPSFAALQTIWTESFDSNDKGWYFDDGDIIFPSYNINCPNYPDACVEVPWKSTSDDDCCWAGIDTDVSMYSAIQLQVDITGFNLESGGGDADACEIWWTMDEMDDWEVYSTVYLNGVYKDVIIDFPLPDQDAYTWMQIDLQVYGDASNDRCFYDNAILRGIPPTKALTKTPTNLPTNTPTKHSSDAPTLYPSNDPTEVSTNPTTHPSVSPTRNPSITPTKRPSITPTSNPSTAPINNPSITPTNNPSHPTLRADIPNPITIHVTQETTSSGITDNTDSVGNEIRDSEDPNTVPTMVIVMAIICILILCFAVAIVGFIRGMKRNKVTKRAEMDKVVSKSSYDNQILYISRTTDVHIEPQNVTRCPPPPPVTNVAMYNMKINQSAYDNQIMYPINDAHHIEPQHVTICPPVADVLEICDDDNRCDVDNHGPRTMEGEGNMDINQFATPNSGLPNIAPDEFVIVGGDEDQDEEAYHSTVNATVNATQGLY